MSFLFEKCERGCCHRLYRTNEERWDYTSAIAIFRIQQGSQEANCILGGIVRSTERGAVDSDSATSTSSHPYKEEPLKDSSGSTPSDLELVARIKLALKVDEHLIESRYGIEVLEGHAVLLGVVISEDEKLAVERAAKGIKEVTNIKNFLLQVEQGYGKLLSR